MHKYSLDSLPRFHYKTMYIQAQSTYSRSKTRQSTPAGSHAIMLAVRTSSLWMRTKQNTTSGKVKNFASFHSVIEYQLQIENSNHTGLFPLGTIKRTTKVAYLILLNIYR
jgi:hypothetical protein